MHPVRELLRARPESVRRVFYREGVAAGAALAREAARLGIDVLAVSAEELARRSGRGHHQGIVAEAAAFPYVGMGDILCRRPALVVALDCVTDEQNLGAIARTAEGVGAGGMVLPADRAAGVGPVALRVSAGALEHLAVARVTNLARALGALGEAGYWRVGLWEGAGRSLFEVRKPGRVVLVVGGEGRGLRRVVKEACDVLVALPMRGRVGSLNASAAAAAGLYWLGREVGVVA